MIRAVNLTFSYPGSRSNFALRGVSLSLEKGERVGLMGPNGSGKTTLIRCLNGLICPNTGEVLVDNLSINESKNLFEIRRRVGMVFQNPDNQIVTTTVTRELAFGMENLGIPSVEMKKRIEAALIHFNLMEYRNTSPNLLSGGERQKLALASVWVMQPGYLILDEPTSLLDPVDRKETLRLIENAVKIQKMGILLVTQYPDEALTCDRLLIIDSGKIILEGPPTRVFQNCEALRHAGLNIPVEIELANYLKEVV